MNFVFLPFRHHLLLLNFFFFLTFLVLSPEHRFMQLPCSNQKGSSGASDLRADPLIKKTSDSSAGRGGPPIKLHLPPAYTWRMTIHRITTAFLSVGVLMFVLGEGNFISTFFWIHSGIVGLKVQFCFLSSVTLLRCAIPDYTKSPECIIPPVHSCIASVCLVLFLFLDKSMKVPTGLMQLWIIGTWVTVLYRFQAQTDFEVEPNKASVIYELFFFSGAGIHSLLSSPSLSKHLETGVSAKW